MDLFSTIARCGSGAIWFNADAAVWDEMVTRGAIVRPMDKHSPAGTVAELAELHCGGARLYMERTRKMTRSELEARRLAREEEARREEQALLDEGPVNYVAEQAAKDRWQGVA